MNTSVTFVRAIVIPTKVLDMKYTGRNYIWGGLEP